MARTARGFRPVPTRTCRKTSWSIGPGSSALTVVSTNATTILGQGASFILDGLTIVRIRGSLRMFLTTAGAVEGFHCAVGMGIVTDEAFAVGQSAMPRPIADAGWNGWMYHRYFDVMSLSTLAAGDNNNWVAFEVDTKAMRKVAANETLFMSLQHVEIGTAVAQVLFDSRVLVKLA